MKLLTMFWLPKPTPSATAPPSTVKAVSGTSTSFRANSVNSSTSR